MKDQAINLMNTALALFVAVARPHPAPVCPSESALVSNGALMSSADLLALARSVNRA
jgi:ABC-type uncharacterized transport system substrate-binding protein